MYPISKLINDSLDDNHLRHVEFVRKLGFTNINRGMRRLHGCLEKGHINHFILNKMVTELSMDPEKIRFAIQETQLMKAQERREERLRTEQRERENFRPHLYALSDAPRPFNICAYAMFGGESQRSVLLPEDITDFNDAA